MDFVSSSLGSLYEENLNENNTFDCSAKKLEFVPKLPNHLHLCALYLQDNQLTTLPDDLFPRLPNLMWLDLRNNLLMEIPKSIDGHKSLTHLLLQNNNLKSLPNELGNVLQLNVLQVSGNPIKYPPKEILCAGVKTIQAFLRTKYIEELLKNPIIEDSDKEIAIREDSDCESYNSVLDVPESDILAEEATKTADSKPTTMVEVNNTTESETMTIKLNEKPKKDDEIKDDESETSSRKCKRYSRSWKPTFPPYYQSAKYLKPLYSDSAPTQMEKMKQAFLNDMALKKHKELIETKEKILQDRKNLELLNSWRRSYRNRQLLAGGVLRRRMEARDIPYDTSPEYMTLLSREDIEKDLPDKYRKMITRKSKPTIPRKNKSDVHLAIKIKKLFENLEAIDLNRKSMTPRTEQKALLNEIQKITEIKNKLSELTTANNRFITG